MTTLPTISKARPTDPSMDYELLRAEGIRHLEQLATQIWTDFNAHDPGITILETLCYAITDLGYRANLPIEDLLAGDPENPAGQKTYFTVEEILKAAPVTELDFRKLLLDCPGVKNAWLEKATSAEVPLFVGEKMTFKEGREVREQLENLILKLKEEGYEWVRDEFALERGAELVEKLRAKGISDLANELSDFLEGLICHYAYYPLGIPGEDGKVPPNAEQLQLNGLYKMILELDDDIDPNNFKITSKVKELVSKKLNANRSLCEDFLNVKILEVEKLCLCMDLELSDEAEAGEVIAKVVAAIQEYLAPTIPFYSFQDLLDKGMSCEEICNGPALKKGFVLKEDLEKSIYRKTILKSDLYRIILDQAEVISVKEVFIKGMEDADFSGDWCYTLKDCHKGIIDICCSQFHISKGLLHSKVAEAEIEPHLELIQLQQENLIANPNNRLAHARGNFRKDLKEFVSLQYEFPGVYAIGDQTVPDSAPALRKAQAKQLQAYLLFYDRILADYLGQLSGVRDLFAVEQDVYAPTQLYQSLYEIPGVSHLLVDFANFEITENGILALIKTDPEIIDKLKKMMDYSYEGKASFWEAMHQVFGHHLPQYRKQLQELFQTGANQFEITEEQISKLYKIEKSKIDELQALLGTVYQGMEAFLDAMRNILGEDLAIHQQNLIELFKTGTLAEDNWNLFIESADNAYEKKRKDLTENDLERQSRRNQILDHMLARFGEQFTAYATGLFKSTGDAENDPWVISYDDYLLAKKDYLLDLPKIGSERGQAYDCKSFLPNGRSNVWNTNNVAGVKKKMYRLLGMGEGTTESIFGDPNYELIIHSTESKDGYPVYQILLRERSTKDVLLYSNRSRSRKKVLESREKIHEYIREEEHYKINTSAQHPGKARLVFVNEPDGDKVILRSESLSEKEIERLQKRMALLMDTQQSSKEGFHVVEHILLRPDDPKDELLALALNCEEGPHATKDPYSFWITVFLPNWVKRFQSEDFQNYFEQTFRLALPAHIAPRFCWLDEGEMIAFEASWKRWREEKARCKPSECEVSKYTRELVLLMNEMKCSCNCKSSSEEVSKCLNSQKFEAHD